MNAKINWTELLAAQAAARANTAKSNTTVTPELRQAQRDARVNRVVRSGLSQRNRV